MTADFRLPVRNFQVTQGADASEGNCSQAESVITLPLKHTALLLMDVWEHHENKGYEKRMREHCTAQILPVLSAARQAGLPVIYACHGQEIAAVAKPGPNDTVLPQDLDTSSFVAQLGALSIRNLLYCGYASNWCILFRPEGISHVADALDHAIILRDASIGFESPETEAGRWCHRVAVNIIEGQFGYSASNKDLIDSLSPDKKEPSMNSPVTLDDLRDKWRHVPIRTDSGEIDSNALNEFSDDKLLAFWEENRKRYCEGDGFAIRGWYQLLYREFCGEKRILDIGCGLGFDSISMLESGASHVTFTDIVESNVKTLQRLCRIKKLEDRCSFRFIKDLADYEELDAGYDVIMAIGSLHHSPHDLLKQEVPRLAAKLRTGGRWLQLAYPHERWEKEGKPSFEEWGVTTNFGTPWTEWYDLEKLQQLLPPDQFRPVFTTNFHHDEFVWFDLIKSE